MKINEVLLAYPFDMNLKVGCKKSQSYWYVGTVGDFLHNMTMYSAELHSYAKRSLDRANDELATALRNPPTPSTYARKILKTEADPNPTAEGFIFDLDVYFKDLVIKQKTVNRRDQALARFIPLKKREVVEAFEADMAVELDPCLVLLVEGREPGGFWTTEEAKNKPEIRFGTESKIWRNLKNR